MERSSQSRPRCAQQHEDAKREDCHPYDLMQVDTVAPREIEDDRIPPLGMNPTTIAPAKIANTPATLRYTDAPYAPCPGRTRLPLGGDPRGVRVVPRMCSRCISMIPGNLAKTDNADGTALSIPAI
jgi:hypothetical protein